MASMIIAGMIGVISFVVTRGIAESLITKDMTDWDGTISFFSDSSYFGFCGNGIYYDLDVFEK